MAAIDIDKVIFDIGHSRDDWQRFLANPHPLLAQHRDLGAEEREAILTGDVAKLYAWGVNGYLLLRYCQWQGADFRELTRKIEAGETLAASVR